MSLFNAGLFFKIVLKNKEPVALQIITLAVAFASTSVIVLFSVHEFGFDRAHPQSDKIFRIITKNQIENFSGNRLSAKVSETFYSSLLSQLSSDSVLISRFKVLKGLKVSSDASPPVLQKIHTADPALLDILSVTFADGKPELFKTSNSIIVSESASLKLLGTDRPVGKTVTIHSGTDSVSFSVVAVFRDFPQNVHDDIQVVIPFDSLGIQNLGFRSADFGVLGRTSKGGPGHFQGRIDKVISLKTQSLLVQPLTDVYFGPRVTGEEARHGDYYSMMIVLAISFLILILAVANFINIQTIMLPGRAKEIAIRKLSGSGRETLILSFLKESVIIVVISLLMGLVLIFMTNSFLESILQVELIGLIPVNAPAFAVTLLSVIICIALAPIFLLGKFINATPNRLLAQDTITFPAFKKVITSFQLGICVFLLITSAVVKRQVSYSLIKEPGRNHEQVIYLNYPTGLTPEGLRQLQRTWKDSNPHIVDLMATTQLPQQVNSKEVNSPFFTLAVDPGYKDFFDLQLMDGRWFRVNDPDSLFLVNEAGKELLATYSQPCIGTFKDLSGNFNYPAVPLKLKLARYNNYNFLFIRILEVDIRKTVAYLSTVFDEGKAAKIFFLDKEFEAWLMYQDRLNNLSELLVIVSIFLSCCAIYGLALSIVRDKLKQIAIHKLLGASTATIIRILIRQFAEGFGTALLIVVPISFLLLREFLRNFVYTTPFSFLDPFYPVAICTIIVIGLCCFHAWTLNRRELTDSLKG